MAQQLVYAHDILNDAIQEDRENHERECNKEFVENLNTMNNMVREKLEDMFEIVKKHEKTNKNIKIDLQTSLQALKTQYYETELYKNHGYKEAYKNKVEEMNHDKESLFMAEKERYHKRHSIRVREFKDLLLQVNEYLDQPRLMYDAREKVLDMRKIQKFKNDNSLAQIIKWDSTFEDETFYQLNVVDSTLVSDDAYKNEMKKNY